MLEPGSVFERKEIKFQISEAQRKDFLSLSKEYMHPDEYGESTVMSLYFDTDDYRLMRRSAEHPVYKEKLRMRSYGVPENNSNVFLEIKKKLNGIVYKRRISLTYPDFLRFTSGETDALPDTQIAREIEYLLHMYPTLSPKILVMYERSAFFANDDLTTRVTFDRNIRYRFGDVLPHTGDSGKKVFPDNTSIMELKYFNSAPKYVSDILTELKIKPRSFSKCGTAYINEVLRRV